MYPVVNLNLLLNYQKIVSLGVFALFMNDVVDSLIFSTAGHMSIIWHHRDSDKHKKLTLTSF